MKQCSLCLDFLCFSIVENATVFTVTGKLLLLVETVTFWGLFGKKKTHISNITWQLTVETNRGSDLLMEQNVGV